MIGSGNFEIDIFAVAAIVVGYVAWCALMIFPLWRIFARTGMVAAWSLLFAVPVAGPLLILVLLAFSDWPSAVGD